MQHIVRTRALLLALSTGALLAGVACGSDQNRNAEAPENVPPAEPPNPETPLPSDTSMPAPNGQPTDTPPDMPQATPQSQNDPGNPGASAPGDAAQLSQNEVAQIADLANTAEVEQAQLALNKARAASVKKFATMMVKDHTEAKQNMAKLVQKLNLEPAPSAPANQLKSDADQIMSQLRAVAGANFDATYVDSQVKEHQKVLDVIDNKLIPAVKDQALIDALKKMRATVDAHLTRAKELQAELAPSGSSSPAAAR